MLTIGQEHSYRALRNVFETENQHLYIYIKPILDIKMS